MQPWRVACTFALFLVTTLASPAGVPAAASHPASESAAADIHGILIMSCDNGVTISEVAPVSGARARLVAHFPTEQCRVSSGVDTENVPSPLRAQLFNRTFTLMAQNVKGGGNNNLDVAAMTRTGHVIDLTPKTGESAGGGFGGPPCDGCQWEEAPLFQPGSSWMYFVRRGKSGFTLMKVNPLLGMRSRARANYTEFPTEHFSATMGSPFGVVFSPSGTHIIPFSWEDMTTGTGPFLFNPTATLAASYIVQADSNTCIDVAAPDKIFAGGFGTGMGDPCSDIKFGDPGCGRPNAWVGDHEFLCTDGRGISLVNVGTNLRSSSAKSLIPTVGRENRDPVPDPTDKRFAFLSRVPRTDTTSASGEQLWVGSLAGGKLIKVAAVPDDAAIIGWR